MLGTYIGQVIKNAISLLFKFLMLFHYCYLFATR